MVDFEAAADGGGKDLEARLQPTNLMGFSSVLPHLVREAQAGRLRIAPRRVMAISEPLLPEARTAIRQAWDVPVGSPEPVGCERAGWLVPGLVLLRGFEPAWAGPAHAAHAGIPGSGFVLAQRFEGVMT